MSSECPCPRPFIVHSRQDVLSVFEFRWAAHLDILTSEVSNFAREFPSIINRARWHVIRPDDTVRQTDALIVFAECGSLVNDTGTVGICDVLVVQHPEGMVLELRSQINQYRGFPRS